ncbi:hypothetical protein PGO_003785 [Plasmodium gonderi]|uniref:Variable surface protein n=1 Tax=Plasmodium gonderi TaxID=77519 RepID=A0A1Y1JTZ0_PLAGO|nr:hypothetical protein PGO_003785 [Plasmodium gonderi]GAW84577.1 hypothetical protein PGO_003785 [Plasmodium gonderi]
MAELDQILKDFPAHEKYENLNRKSVNNEGKYIKWCNYFKTADKEAINFCKRAVTNLSDIFNTQNEGNRNDSCVYFQHWFTDHIRKNFSNNDKFFSNYDPSNYLYDVMNTVNYENKRDFNYSCFISRDARSVKVEKDLHDYFRNFHKINCKGLDKDKCQMYHRYVQYIKPLYKDRKDRHLCCYLANGEVEDRCKHYFTCDKKYDPQNLLYMLERQMNSTDNGKIIGSAWNLFPNNQNYGMYDENWNSYGSSVFASFKPNSYESINQSLFSSRKFHNGLIVFAMIGIFFGLLFYIKVNNITF